MSTENETLARRFFEDLCNGRNLDVADEILAPDHRYHDPQSPDGGTGPEAMKQTVALYQTPSRGAGRCTRSSPTAIASPHAGPGTDGT